jgi:hypothetical protein
MGSMTKNNPVTATDAHISVCGQITKDELFARLNEVACPNCGATGGRKLNSDCLARLTRRFFVWGSQLRCECGAAPQIQFNRPQKTSITMPSWLEADIGLIERALCVGFFHYGPRLCMIGEVEPEQSVK